MRGGHRFPVSRLAASAQPMLLCADVGGTNTRLHLFKVPDRLAKRTPGSAPKTRNAVRGLLLGGLYLGKIWEDTVTSCRLGESPLVPGRQIQDHLRDHLNGVHCVLKWGRQNNFIYIISTPRIVEQ